MKSGLLRPSAWVGSLLLLLCAKTAQAEAGKVLLIPVPVEEGGWPEAEGRVTDEFEALGLIVARGPAALLNECSDDRATRDAIREANAIGAIELRMKPGNPRTLRICVVDVVTGKATARHWPESGGFRVDQAALLTVEILHASLLELDIQHPTRGEVSAPTVVTDRLLPPERILGVRAGVFGWATLGGVGAGAGALVGLSVPILGIFSIDGEAGFSFVPGELKAINGQARVFAAPLRIHWVADLLPRGDWALHVGAGGGVLAAQMVGSAAEPFRASQGIATTWMLSGMVGGGFRISESLRLRSDFRAGWAPQPLEIDILGTIEGRVGQGWFDAGVSLEWFILTR